MIDDEILDAPYTRTENEVYLRTASRGKRFVNYLFDLIGYYSLMGAIGFIIAAFSPATVAVYNGETLLGSLLNLSFGSIVMVLYYTGNEVLFDGKSLGKFITRTRAVSKNGEVPTVKQIMIRSLTRLVPFEAFSFLGGEPVRGWHDSWSDTYVIQE